MIATVVYSNPEEQYSIIERERRGKQQRLLAPWSSVKNRVPQWLEVGEVVKFHIGKTAGEACRITILSSEDLRKNEQKIALRTMWRDAQREIAEETAASRRDVQEILRAAEDADVNSAEELLEKRREARRSGHRE